MKRCSWQKSLEQHAYETGRVSVIYLKTHGTLSTRPLLSSDVDVDVDVDILSQPNRVTSGDINPWLLWRLSH